MSENPKVEALLEVIDKAKEMAEYINAEPEEKGHNSYCEDQHKAEEFLSFLEERLNSDPQTKGEVV